MNYRWTMKELREASDKWIILQCVRDRQSKLTNPYTPLSERLTQIINKLERGLYNE